MAGTTRVFITRLIPEKGLDLLRRHCGVVDVFTADRPIPQATLKRSARNADAVLCLLSDRIGADVISYCRRLRVISNYAVGIDNIDLAAATGRGIVVTNTPGVLTEATAELTWALLFAVARRVVESDRFTRAGKFIGWGPMLMLGRDIQGKTLGIVGAGRIGQAVAERAGGMRMRILYSLSSRKPAFERRTGARRVGLRELLRRSDFITFH
ncbi:MAG: NAD(P)-dependent oxidoreductase, partial [Planctomycetota bacterium]|nr:NAD(P)-dependent oxidoreductase [Planctomycetota bacterium]